MSKKVLLIALVVVGVAGYSGYVLRVNKGALVEAKDEVKKEENMSRKFDLKTVFEINPYGRMSDAVGRNRMMTRQFLQTQFTVIASEETLGRAIDDYDLENLLGQNKQELIKEIGGSIKLGQERGTDLIKLLVNADSELKAQQIAYAVTHAYEWRRVDELEKRRKEVIEQFAEKRKEQENRVEVHRVRLYSLAKKLQVPFEGVVGESYGVKEPMRTIHYPPEQMTRFGKVREDYERELAILDAIKQVEFTEVLNESLEIDPIIIHEAGWSDEVGAEMRLLEK